MSKNIVMGTNITHLPNILETFQFIFNSTRTTCWYNVLQSPEFIFYFIHSHQIDIAKGTYHVGNQTLFHIFLSLLLCLLQDHKSDNKA